MASAWSRTSRSLRAGRASLVDAYASVRDGEAWLIGAHIPEYTEGTWTNHEPRRTRKLLLHKGEIDRLIGKTKEGGRTLVPLVGQEWPIAYKRAEDERLTHLRGMGVRAFPSMVYPHKPDMAAWLNAWASDFGRRTPDCLHTATFYPEPSAPAYVDEALAAGARLFKLHVQVGGYDPRDPLLDPVWARLAETATPVVVHCGNGPRRGRFTGPDIFAEVLARHLDLVPVIAHMGMPDYAEFVALADRYPRLLLDTTMAFSDFAERSWPYPRDLVPRLAVLGDRILLGTDFPNIPYPFAHQLDVLARVGLGDEWLRAVCWD